MENTAIKDHRRIYYDFMRICAAFLVIFNHCPGYMLYSISDGGIKTWVYAFITMFTRLNVPVFFMITGALLLGKEESLKAVFKKRISRIAVVLLTFSIIMYVLSGDSVSITGFIRKFSSNTIMSIYWYLYAYLSFLFALPYLRRIVQKFDECDFIWFVALHFIFGSLIPIINYMLTACGKEMLVIASQFEAPLMVKNIFFYPMIGYYLDRVVDAQKIKGKHIVFLVSCAVVGIVISSAITIHQGESTGYTQSYVMLFDYVTAMTFFVAMKWLFENKGFLKRNLRTQMAISRVGKLTFGMYLMDPIWKIIFFSRWNAFLEPYLPTIVVSVCWCVFSMVLSGFVTCILKRIPVVGEML